MSWDRVSRWDIEQRKGYVLLTLRGEGTATPLAVPAWTLDDLETVMRDMTADWPVLPAAAATDPAAPARLTRQEGEPRRSWRARIPWKVVVTVVLLGLLATAVVLVLLQSAGIISWGFLGPTA